MSGVLHSVNQRTQLVGQNRLELLLFRMAGSQLYGINVFKVKEVLQCPKLISMPGSNRIVRGVAHVRAETITILDLSLATGYAPLKDLSTAFVIITEYNKKTQGFLVESVDRIVNMNWSDIHSPPKGTGKDHFLTAVTEVEGEMVEILDVEKILAEVAPVNEEVSEGLITEEVQSKASERKVLIVDDSRVARKQVMRCLEGVGLEVVALNDGLEAWQHLQEIAESGESIYDYYLMLVSDIEMPEMDGYTLTSNIREDSRMSQFHVVLHSSLSGVFNKAMVEKVGVNDFIAKFDPDVLAEKVISRLNAT